MSPPRLSLNPDVANQYFPNTYSSPEPPIESIFTGKRVRFEANGGLLVSPFR